MNPRLPSTPRTPHHDDLEKLAALEGPVLSIYMNTHTHGKASALDGTRFARLTKDIGGQLLAAGHDGRWVEKYLDPLDRLADDDAFWQHQRRSIAVFRDAQESYFFLLDDTCAETVSIGDTPLIAPLLAHIHQIPPFLLLALSKNEVRLFACDDEAADAIVDDSIPRSFDDALRYEDPQAQLQFHSPGGVSIAHGHGIGDEVAKERLERFLVAVDRSIVELEPNPPRPLILAAVDHNVSRYRQISSYPALLPVHLSGNPDRMSPEQLHRDALALMTTHAEKSRIADVERIRSLVGTGRLETTTDAIVDAARTGRVDTLYVARPSTNGTSLNDAVVASLRNGGDVVHSPVPLLEGIETFAVTRW